MVDRGEAVVWLALALIIILYVRRDTRRRGFDVLCWGGGGGKERRGQDSFPTCKPPATSVLRRTLPVSTTGLLILEEVYNLKQTVYHQETAHQHVLPHLFPSVPDSFKSV